MLMRWWCVVVLTNLGEKMTDNEVDELLKVVDTSSGEINYTGLSLSTTFLSARVWRVTRLIMGELGRPRPDYPRKLVASYIPIPLPCFPRFDPTKATLFLRNDDRRFCLYFSCFCW